MEYTPRRKLTREFKLEAVRQAAMSEKPKAQLARELGVRVGQLRTWRLEFEKEAVTGIAKPDRSAADDLKAAAQTRGGGRQCRSVSCSQLTSTPLTDSGCSIVERWPQCSMISSRARGTRAAIASWSLTGVTGSSRPHITSVGTFTWSRSVCESGRASMAVC